MRAVKQGGVPGTSAQENRTDRAKPGHYSCTVNEPTPEQLREWITAYKSAAVDLREQRWKELRELTPERALWMSEELLSIPVREEVRHRESSGLVEQQAIFSRARKS